MWEDHMCPLIFIGSSGIPVDTKLNSSAGDIHINILMHYYFMTITIRLLLLLFVVYSAHNNREMNYYLLLLIWLCSHLKKAVFLDVTPCGSCKLTYRGTYRLRYQDNTNQLAWNNVSSNWQHYTTCRTQLGDWVLEWRMASSGMLALWLL
jgi:hypothetical protein